MPQLAPPMIPKGRNQINPSLKMRSRPTPTIVYLYGYRYVGREWTRATFTYERQTYVQPWEAATAAFY